MPAMLAAGIRRDLVRLQAHGLTAPWVMTASLVTRLHVDLAALGQAADPVGETNA